MLGRGEREGSSAKRRNLLHSRPPLPPPLPRKKAEASLLTHSWALTPPSFWTRGGGGNTTKAWKEMNSRRGGKGGCCDRDPLALMEKSRMERDSPEKQIFGKRRGQSLRQHVWRILCLVAHFLDCNGRGGTSWKTAFPSSSSSSSLP